MNKIYTTILLVFIIKRYLHSTCYTVIFLQNVPSASPNACPLGHSPHSDPDRRRLSSYTHENVDL